MERRSRDEERAGTGGGAPGPGIDPVPRPAPWVERLSHGLFLLFSPRLARKSAEPPAELVPFEQLAVPRSQGSGHLAATFFPARGEAWGTVLLLHPWLPWGRAYFHRHGRVSTLRQAGYHVLAVDFPGFGGSGPPCGYFDRDVDDALDHLARLCPGLPLHVWGVSAGGYWAHLCLSRRGGVAAAIFEDVTPHLLEWSWRNAPRGRPAYALFRHLFPSAYRFLDLRLHVPHLRAVRSAYLSGADDPTVVPEETERLAARAGSARLVIPGARHLEAIKVAPDAVFAFALQTFADAEAAGARLVPRRSRMAPPCFASSSSSPSQSPQPSLS